MRAILIVLFILTLFANEVFVFDKKNLKRLTDSVNHEYVYYKKKIFH